MSDVRSQLKRLDEAKTEGFWSESHPPIPSGSPWPGEAKFLVALAYAQTKAERVRYRGWSNCRVCGKPNGSETFILDGWQWPSGFMHYIEAHHVVPSGDFLRMILAGTEA